MKPCVGFAALAVIASIAVAWLLLWRPSERFKVGTNTFPKIAGSVAVNLNGIPKFQVMTLNKRLSLPNNVTSFTVAPNANHVALIFDETGKQTAFAETKTTYPSSRFEAPADIKYYRAIEIRKK